MRVARNKEHHLTHGWFAVKNRSVQERHDGYDLEQRHASEKAFFSCHPWNKLNHSRAGLAQLREFLRDMVNSMLQDNINSLVEKIQGMTESNTDSSRFTDSIDDRRELDEKETSFEQLRPVSQSVSEASKTEDEDADLEVGEIKKRPTMLINACTCALTLALVMTLVGLGCGELAQEIATDGSWYRLFLLVTAPLQVFVSLVSHR